jgi:hypothetical protein
MSRADELRRPVRLLRPGEVGEVGPEQPRAPAPALAPSAERFRRTLAGPRRAEPEPQARGAAAPQAREPVPPAGAGVVRASAALAETSGLQPLLEPDEADAVAPPAAVEDTPLPTDAPPERPTVAAVPGEAAGAEPVEGWADRMARMVATLCSRADPAFVTWTVTVPMDPDTLPQTELRLHMAPHWLSLRFASESPRAVQLILAHRERLVALLRRAGGVPHEVDVEVV